MDIELLEADYRANQRRAEDLKQNVLDQLKRLFEKRGVTLGIPLEARVKTWSSIAEKIDRKGLTLEKISYHRQSRWYEDAPSKGAYNPPGSCYLGGFMPTSCNVNCS